MMLDLFHNLLFPPACSACGELLKIQDYAEHAPSLCQKCRAEWEKEKTIKCEICGKSVTECSCVTDEMRSAHLKEYYKLAYYRQSTPNAVQNLVIYGIKRQRRKNAIRFLSDELSKSVCKWLEEKKYKAEDCAVVWLPRSLDSLLATGTDQARELAKGISDRTGIKCRELVRRNKNANKTQKNLTPAERKKNAKEAFALAENIAIPADTHLLLIDDIVTTGASMSAVAELLRKANFHNLTAFSVLSDDVNRTPTEKQPVIDLKNGKSKSQQ